VRARLSGRTPAELANLLSAVAIALLGVLIIATLYFGREIFVPISLAILLSFVLAPWSAYCNECGFPAALQ
jgi:predicted PurR-regulated permease PerM